MGAARDVLDRLRADGGSARLAGEQVAVRPPPGGWTPGLREQIVAHKAEIIALLKGEAQRPGDESVLPAAAGADKFAVHVGKDMRGIVQNIIELLREEGSAPRVKGGALVVPRPSGGWTPNLCAAIETYAPQIVALLRGEADKERPGDGRPADNQVNDDE